MHCLLHILTQALTWEDAKGLVRTVVSYSDGTFSDITSHVQLSEVSGSSGGTPPFTIAQDPVYNVPVATVTAKVRGFNCGACDCKARGEKAHKQACSSKYVHVPSPPTLLPQLGTPATCGSYLSAAFSTCSSVRLATGSGQVAVALPAPVAIERLELSAPSIAPSRNGAAMVSARTW